MAYIINGIRDIAFALSALDVASAAFYALAAYCFLNGSAKKIFIKIAFVLSFLPFAYFSYLVLGPIINRTDYDFANQSFYRAIVFNIFTLAYTAAIMIFYFINKDPSLKTLSSGNADTEAGQISPE